MIRNASRAFGVALSICIACSCSYAKRGAVGNDSSQELIPQLQHSPCHYGGFSDERRAEFDGTYPIIFEGRLISTRRMNPKRGVDHPGMEAVYDEHLVEVTVTHVIKGNLDQRQIRFIVPLLISSAPSGPVSYFGAQGQYRFWLDGGTFEGATHVATWFRGQ